VALFEWGGRFRAADNTRREMEMVDKYYLGGGGIRTASGEITLAAARAVGGSTAVYTGVSFEPPARVLEKWAVPGLDAADLTPRLQRYARENNVHYHDEAEINRNNRLFRKGCRRLGWVLRRFPVNTRDCAGLNTCNLGCAHAAKQGTAQVQIPAAEAAGVEVYPFCRIDRAGDGILHGRVLPPEHGLAAGPLPPGPLRVRAHRIVLAGGALNTPPLLMRSYADWRRHWPALGRYFTCHPALTLIAEHDRPVDGSLGHPKSFYCDRFAESGRFLLETCFYPPFATARNLIGYGPQLDSLMSRMDRQQQILALILDRARPENRIAVDGSGRIRVHYRVDDELREIAAEAIRAAGRIFFAAGATRAHLPGTQSFFTYRRETGRLADLVRPERLIPGRVTLSAAHLMGGCRMGADTETSVTDAWGRVHGMPDLYVADASLFPDSVEVNPYLTVMALADRVAEALRHDLGFRARGEDSRFHGGAAA
jgi:choline dehydrogenase-like flavoprotein